MRIILLSVLVYLITSTAHAETVERTEYAIPKNFHIFDNGGHVFVDLPEKGCSSGRYILLTSHTSFDTIVSTMLAAQVSERKISVRFDGCNPNNRGFITGVYLQ